NEAEDRTGVHQGKLTTDNFDFRRVLAFHLPTTVDKEPTRVDLPRQVYFVLSSSDKTYCVGR
ncbi:hypothetical protein P7J36_11270, partial [Streptococcus suis]